jgi:cytochrome c oxidase subunit 2
VPDLGWKKDANPGFINEAWTSVDNAGTYRGQCTELCGKDHAFMPIVVIAMDEPDYNAWVEKQKAALAAEAGSANKEWTKEELVAKGKAVYETNCSSCHMVDGAGLPGAFPAIKGSPVVTGDINAQVKLMLNGKGMMPAFGKMLSAVDFAAVVTYTRNGLGNSVGDFIQPSGIQTLQTESPGAAKNE